MEIHYPAPTDSDEHKMAFKLKATSDVFDELREYKKDFLRILIATLMRPLKFPSI